MFGLSHHQGRRRTSRSSQSRGRAQLSIERLETRELLSAGVLGDNVALPTLFVPPVSPSPNSPHGYTPAQIRHAYGFDQIWFTGAPAIQNLPLKGIVPANGRGQTIAIVDAFDNPTIASDLQYFDQTFGLPDPPSIRKVNQTGGTNYPVQGGDWAWEIALDVEWAHAMAPGANILLVEASSNSSTDMLAAVDYARDQPGVSVVSMSWRFTETAAESVGHFATPFRHAPVAFVASSGDVAASPSWPAVVPNVLAVGGTALTLDNQGNYISELGWSQSSGGPSAYMPEPTYQNAVQSTGKRGIPDVAYDADQNTGFPVYHNGIWQELGGTSAGAPQWAALIAIADQGRALASKSPLGSVPELIYSLPASDFHDITLGSNGYPAGPGYDYVTGRGSPIANRVVSDLVAATDVPTITIPGLNLMTPFLATGSPALTTTTVKSPLIPQVNFNLPVFNPLPVGYTPAQIRHAYGFDQITFNSPKWVGGTPIFSTIAGDGSGQTIAIVDLNDDPNIVSDLHTFDQAFGLPDPPHFTKVDEHGGTHYPAKDASWDVEISLDVEWAHALAPKANILLVEAAPTFADFLTAVDYARHYSGVSVVSMSVGFGESQLPTESSYDSYFTTPAGHIGGSGLAGGITFVAATGDDGGISGQSYPAVSPNVLAVGGTVLTLDAAGNYAGETAWAGSTGGTSAYEPEPWYQYPLYTGGKRSNPDVAYAAGAPGFAVYDSVAYNGFTNFPLGEYGWLQTGPGVGIEGTSAGAPQWAALFAIANQGRALAGTGSLGNGQAALYSLSVRDFHDIVYDTMLDSTNYLGLAAGPGYDQVTGRGTPIANLVVHDLLTATSNPLIGLGFTVAGSAQTSVSAQPTFATSLTYSGTGIGGPNSPFEATSRTLRWAEEANRDAFFALEDTGFSPGTGDQYQAGVHYGDLKHSAGRVR
jgi:subtilase family serine protease